MKSQAPATSSSETETWAATNMLASVRRDFLSFANAKLAKEDCPKKEPWMTSLRFRKVVDPSGRAPPKLRGKKFAQ